MYEFSCTDYIVFHVHMEKEKRSSQKKRKKKEQKYQENLKTSEMQILSVLVKIS